MPGVNLCNGTMVAGYEISINAVSSRPSSVSQDSSLSKNIPVKWWKEIHMQAKLTIEPSTFSDSELSLLLIVK